MAKRIRALAFVLDMGPNGLGIARSLGRSGIPVVGVDFWVDAAGLRSRYCKPLLIPSPIKDPEGALSSLLKEGRKSVDDGILFPASDVFALFVSRFRKELSDCFQFAMPSQDMLESLVNKREQYELAKQIGIPYPKTYYPENMQEVEEVKDRIGFPAFLKPSWPYIWQAKYPNKGFEVNSPQQLIDKYQEIFSAKLDAMVQSVIPGPDSNIVEVYAYMSRGNAPLATFLTRKLRQYPNKYGVGTCMESLHDAELLEIGLEFFRGVRYVGLGSIEFKKDMRDGKYKLLELNVRLGHHNIQATQAGVNFPVLQYLDLTGQPIGIQKDYKDGVIWLDAVNDFLAFRESESVGLSLLDWLRSMSRADCHSYLALDDMRPFLYDCARTVLSYLRIFIRKRRWM